LKQFLSTDDKY